MRALICCGSLRGHSRRFGCRADGTLRVDWDSRHDDLIAKGVVLVDFEILIFGVVVVVLLGDEAEGLVRLVPPKLPLPPTSQDAYG